MRTVKNYLFCLLLLETLCVSYALKFPSLVLPATVIYTVSGIAIAFLLLRMPQQKTNLPVITFRLTPVWSYQCALLLFGGLFMYLFTKQWIVQSPLSYKDADMIPIMQVMAERFMQGDWALVYQPVQEIWNGIQPIYLPAMWMPFLAAVKFGFDPRWITSLAVFFSFGIFILLWRAHWQKISGAFLLLAAGILCLWLYTEPSHNFIRLSEEGIVVFYYSLLVLAILSENFLLIGIAAALCALSRYAIAGWLPAMLVYLVLAHKQKPDTIRFILSFVSVVLLLVVLPFGIKPLQIAFQQPQLYIEHAARIWKESPAYFTQSTGLAKFFGPENIVLQHQLLILCSFLLPLIFVFGSIKWKHRNNIPLATLKLTVVIVFALIDVPYQYLFYTSSFISLIAIARVSGVNKV
ncbi:MAG: hypothetical protein ACK4S0_07385 [Sediminibacterium sp.]